jgi:hypothetical protein
MKWQQSTLCKLKLNKCILYLILSVGIPHGLPTKSQCSTKPKKLSEMSETQWSCILHISLNQGKPDFLVWAPTVSFQILDVSVFKTRFYDFYWLVPNG